MGEFMVLVTSIVMLIFVLLLFDWPRGFILTKGILSFFRGINEGDVTSYIRKYYTHFVTAIIIPAGNNHLAVCVVKVSPGNKREFAKVIAVRMDWRGRMFHKRISESVTRESVQSVTMDGKEMVIAFLDRNKIVRVHPREITD